RSPPRGHHGAGRSRVAGDPRSRGRNRRPAGREPRRADGSARPLGHAADDPHRLTSHDIHIPRKEPLMLSTWSPRALAALRIMAGLLFLEHGLIKMIGFPGPGPETLPPMLLIAGLIETFGGLLLVLGLFTRPAAFLSSGLMAAAYLIGHA